MKRFGISLATIVLVAAMSCKGSGGGSGTASATAVFPKDSAAVGGFSFAKLRKTELWTNLKAMAEQRGDSKMDDVKETCGIDTMTAIDSVVFALPVDQNPKNLAVLVNGNISEKKAIECAKKMAKKADKTVKVEKSGNVVSFIDEHNPSETAYASWLSSGSVLFTGGGKEYIESMLAGKNSLKDNAEMMAVMKKIDTSATFWGVSSLQEGPAAMAVASMPFEEKPTTGYVSVDYTKSLSFKMGLIFDNKAAAKAATETLSKEIDQKQSMPMVGAFLKGMKVTGSGNETVVSLELDEKQLDELTNTLKPLLQMMGMGGMGR